MTWRARISISSDDIHCASILDMDGHLPSQVRPSSPPINSFLMRFQRGVKHFLLTDLNFGTPPIDYLLRVECSERDHEQCWFFFSDVTPFHTLHWGILLAELRLNASLHNCYSPTHEVCQHMSPWCNQRQACRERAAIIPWYILGPWLLGRKTTVNRMHRRYTSSNESMTCSTLWRRQIRRTRSSIHIRNSAHITQWTP